MRGKAHPFKTAFFSYKTRRYLTPTPLSPQTAGMTKADIRSLMKARRMQVDPTEQQAASAAIVSRLQALPDFQNANEIACYLSLSQEIDTGAIITFCHANRRRVCVPVWNASEGKYVFARLLPDSVLQAGRLGTREPMDWQEVAPQTIQLVLAPGLAFDRNGGRIGFGGGHYDRLLAACAPGCVKAGLCYAWQVQKKPLPLTDHDIRMNLIITELETITCT